MLDLTERVEFDALCKEVGQTVFRRPVSGTGDLKRFRDGHPLLLPPQASLERPVQDARQLGRQLLEQVLVDFLIRNSHLERDKYHTIPKGVRRVGDPWLVIDGDDNFGRRLEVPKIFVHAAGSSDIAPCESLYFLFVETSALLNFRRDYEPLAKQRRLFRRMCLVPLRQEHVRPNG